MSARPPLISQGSVLTQRLREIVAGRFPAVALTNEAAFRPMDDVAKGEISSSAAIEIARATRQTAEGIADSLIRELSQMVSAQWRNDCGYIVCWGLPSEVLLAEVHADVPSAIGRLAAGDSTTPRVIVCLVPDNTEPVYARIRVVARAAMQALLSVVYEGHVGLWLYPAELQKLSSVSDVVQAFRAAVLRVLAHESEVRFSVALPDNMESDNSGRLAVWTTHHYHDRLAPDVRARLSRARVSGSAQVVMPSDGWLHCRDRALSELLARDKLSALAQRLETDDSWARFLFHAASTVPSGDLDPAVALFDESSSPLWNLRLLRDRFQRFAASQSLPVSRETLLATNAAFSQRRELVVTAVFMPIYVARAIVHSEVAACCAALERMGRAGHAFINSPETRHALAQGELHGESLEIAASVGFGISSILPLLG
jgi:hypothetical protein